ncbi:MAG: hypothetical protein KA502_01315 [Candidatus Methanomethylophilaceae archaeon]|nr:hypothetical protein [Candidatus Methanomethylophilaceae archaeon]
MDDVPRCPYCKSVLVSDPATGCGFCPECKRESVISLDPKVRESFEECLSHLEDVKKLFEMQKYDLCLKKIDGVMDKMVECPDLWYMKSVLSMSNMQKYNYCTCKARSLIQQNRGLVYLSIEDIEKMKKMIPKGWNAAPVKPELPEPVEEKKTPFSFMRKP